MDFNLQSFQELLSSFSASAEGFSAQLQRSLEALLRSDAQFREVCAGRLVDIDNALAENQRVVSAQNELLTRRQTSREELSERISHVEAQIKELELQVARLTQEISEKTRQLNNARAHPQAGQRTPEKLRRQHEMYRKMLQMGLSVQGDALTVEFYGIGAKTRFVQFQISEKGLRLMKISDAIENIDDLVDEFEVTGNIALLIKRIRRGFAQEFA